MLREEIQHSTTERAYRASKGDSRVLEMVVSERFELVSIRTERLSLYRAKFTPLCESGGAVGLEVRSAREAAVLVEVV